MTDDANARLQRLAQLASELAAATIAGRATAEQGRRSVERTKRETRLLETYPARAGDRRTSRRRADRR